MGLVWVYASNDVGFNANNWYKIVFLSSLYLLDSNCISLCFGNLTVLLKVDVMDKKIFNRLEFQVSSIRSSSQLTKV